MKQQLINSYNCWRKILTHCRKIDFLAPMAFRIYLFPIFWMAGVEKITHIDATAQWFGHALGLPFPYVMAYLASGVEIVGAICLIAGFATRLLCIPLIGVMLVAAFGVHFDNGWLAIASGEHVGAMRLGNFLEWLRMMHPEHFQYITEHGQPVILNNGVEFAVTYLIMLVSLFFTGAGRFFSVDYWVKQWLIK